MEDADAGNLSDADCRSRSSRRVVRWLVVIVLIVVVYVFSCGPVLAVACGCREATGNDVFHTVFWGDCLLFYAAAQVDVVTGVFNQYIEWWFDLFGTVGPG